MNADSGRRAIRALLAAGVALLALRLVPCSQPASGRGQPDVPPAVLRVGEVLNYRIDWQRYAGAGLAQLRIVDRGDFYGSLAWHFRASVHTAQPLRALYPMDDQIDSYALVPGLRGRGYEEHFREFGQPQDTSRTLVAPGEVSEARAPRVIVPRGTRDLVSAIYLLRVTNWSEQPELRVPVYDGQNVYEMVAKAGDPSELRLGGGNYQAREIAIRLLDGKKEIPDESFRIWLAEDGARTPLVGEADLPMGKVRMELTSDSAGNPLTPPERSSHPAGN